MYTEKELADLTEEERAAIMEGEDEAEELDEAEEVEEANETDEAEEADEGEEEEADEAEPEKPEATEDKAAAREDRAAPLLNADLPDDLDTRMQEIGTKKSDLVTQFEDGDLTAAEYQAELDKLNKAEREIEQQQFKAKLAQEMQENQQREAWARTVQTFLDNNPQYQASKLMYQTLDMTVRQVAADEANAGLSGDEILAKAHEQIMQEFGLQKPAEEKAPEGKAKGKPTIPPTLNNIPAAEQTDTGNAKFKQLDRLMDSDPLAYEEAMAKLSDSEREAYLASQ